MSDADLLYKIIILQLLSKVDLPLTTTQITDFLQEGRYTDYFNVQNCLFLLRENHMIEGEAGVNSTRYSITPEGEETLELFHEYLTPAIESDIERFLKNNRLKIKIENTLSADYIESEKGGFIVYLKKADRTGEGISLSIHVPTEDIAQTMCVNWKTCYEDAYAALFDALVR